MSWCDITYDLGYRKNVYRESQKANKMCEEEEKWCESHQFGKDVPKRCKIYSKKDHTLHQRK